MKLSVKVKARARQEKVEKVSEGQYKVWVRAAAEKGKANEDVIDVLSGYFKVPKSCIAIVSGHTPAQKIIEVE